jgi:hypothetical protein
MPVFILAALERDPLGVPETPTNGAELKPGEASARSGSLATTGRYHHSRPLGGRAASYVALRALLLRAYSAKMVWFWFSFKVVSTAEDNNEGAAI